MSTTYEAFLFYGFVLPDDLDLEILKENLFKSHGLEAPIEKCKFYYSGVGIYDEIVNFVYVDMHYVEDICEPEIINFDNTNDIIDSLEIGWHIGGMVR